MLKFQNRLELTIAVAGTTIDSASTLDCGTVTAMATD
jgi:hypothetical protein